MSDKLPGLLSSLICTPEGIKFFDISLVTREGDVHMVSKIILAAHSNVLHKIFTHEVDKSKTDFHLPTVSGLTLVLILEWIESGELALTRHNVLDVLETSEILDIPLVSSLCQQWLLIRIAPNNALGIWRFSRDHFLPSLERSSWKFVTTEFVEVSKLEEFHELPGESLKMLLGSDHLSCGEEEVWMGLVRWLGDNQGEVDKLTTIMETIRFGLMDPDFFLRNVHPHPVFHNSGLAIRVEEVLSRVSLGITRTRHIFVRPRCPQSFLFAFGGWSGPGPVDTISVYDPAAATWRDLTTTLPESWAYMRTVVVGAEVFLCGGELEGEWATNMVMKFCPNTMEMSRLSMMRERRNGLSVAVHCGSIYAIGGNNSSVSLSSVERFDISLNQWFVVRSMNKTRSDAGAATLRGKIYVVGGFDGISPTNTAEVFCPAKGTWNMIRSMRVARGGVRAVAMDGLLYMMGGFDGQQRLRSGEVYNPDTNMWSDLPEMKTPRTNYSLAVVQGRLMVMGGFQGVVTTGKVEVLDSTSNIWKEVGELPTSRSGLASAVINFDNLEEGVRESLRWQGGEEDNDDVLESSSDESWLNDNSDEIEDEDMIIG
eukprot:GFUD01017009.1.p1 GENE.GFUD01017009.1~~GFUD01017009.1.p1  ORF type:complete len:597 (+),score=175.10 GFUD01017009.1:93-1883(+)